MNSLLGLAAILIVLTSSTGYCGVMRTITVDPAGAGNYRTLEEARSFIRTINGNMTGDIRIQLKGGYHYLNRTFALSEPDGGTNGYSVIYTSAPAESAVVSGGIPVKNWILYNGLIWKAPFDFSDKVRQLYVNGKRSTMAQGPSSASLKSPADYANASDIELFQRQLWATHFICVKSIQDSLITLQEPYGSIANASHYSVKFRVGTGATMLNAYEFLDKPGEFYFNRNQKMMYYIPRNGENPAAATVIAPSVEVLVSIKGTSSSSRARNIRFENLTFAHSSYNLLQVDSSHGYSSNQGPEGFVYHPSTGLFWERTAIRGAIAVDYAENVNFIGNTFTNLGGTGLLMQNAVRRCSINSNKFIDLAANALTLGHPKHDDFLEPFTLDNVDFPGAAKEEPTFITFHNNYLRNVSAEFTHVPTVHVYYSRYTKITHNDFGPCGYDAISFGWGWGGGARDARIAGCNIIGYNKIDGCMQLHGDGAAIYSLGRQPGTRVVGNYVFTASGSSEGKGFYPDQGSSGLPYANQYLSNVYESKGSFIGTHSGNGAWCRVDGAYYTSDGVGIDTVDVGSKAGIVNVVSYARGSRPQAAQLIVDNAGNTTKSADQIHLPPLADIVSPISGQVFPSASAIPFAVDASDPDGRISRVEFFVGDSLIGADTAAPYTLAIPPQRIIAGSAVLTACAYDNEGMLCYVYPAVASWLNATAVGTTLILDTEVPANIVTTGEWLVNRISTPYNGTGFLTDVNQNKGNKSVRFVPDFPVDGIYEVFMIWSKYATFATNVPIDIHHTSGIATQAGNQRTTSGWKILGSFAFSKGMNPAIGSVVIRTDSTDGVVVADAVKFVLKQAVDERGPSGQGLVRKHPAIDNCFRTPSGLVISYFVPQGEFKAVRWQLLDMSGRTVWSGTSAAGNACGSRTMTIPAAGGTTPGNRLYLVRIQVIAENGKETAWQSKKYLLVQ